MKKERLFKEAIVGNFMCKTRIDFILCTRNIEGFIGSIKYEESSLSDHKPIFMQVDWSFCEKRAGGNGFLNTEILKNEHYVLSISFPVAQMVEHGASNAKIMGSIPRESKS